MEYELVENGEVVTTVTANDEEEAWEIIHKAGIRNKSKIMQLVQI